ncbi:hypothetical protein MOKP76_05750 [Mycobacterium avium subsp. hominissuis]
MEHKLAGVVHVDGRGVGGEGVFRFPIGDARQSDEHRGRAFYVVDPLAQMKNALVRMAVIVVDLPVRTSYP